MTILQQETAFIRLPVALDCASPEEFETSISVIADGLAEDGFIVVDGVFSKALTDQLDAEFEQEWRVNMTPAGIGRGEEFQQDKTVRGDKIKWLEPETPAVSTFLTLMDRVKTNLNRTLFLGLFEYEAHFSLYQRGDFYRTHLDAFRGQVGRKLSTVFYLNRDWEQREGGELVLYHEDETHLADVLPVFSRMVIFLSEEFPHEVKVATRERKSIAGWFRVNQGIRLADPL